MDLSQKKLSKTEWNNIEIPFPEKEKKILKLICDGFHNVDIKNNDTLSLLCLMKLPNDISFVHEHLYITYYSDKIKSEIKKYNSIVDGYDESLPNKKKIKLKNKDLMKINIINKKGNIIFERAFEHIVLEYCTNILKSYNSRSNNYTFYLYSLIQIKKASVVHFNPYVMKYVDFIINTLKPNVKMADVLEQSYNFIEKNHSLMKYADNVLFQHQKDIFRLFQYNENDNGKDKECAKIEAMNAIPSKLVLYTAPTGTGKTLTPLGLSEGYRIIFICAARHIGLALAKSSVCMNKRIGIAFGCETVDDIRLHYFAASEYSINRRSGGIGKVDNTIGDKVQIMICDIKSYLVAMRYMLAFTPQHPGNIEIEETLLINQENIEEYEETYMEEKKNHPSNTENLDKLEKKILSLKNTNEGLRNKIVPINKDYDLITYWDEPTISMDYEDHPLHEMIEQVWKENNISKMVLSCATLPHHDDIGASLNSFQVKFPQASIETISSFDCRKSISLLNQECKSVLPHLLFEDYQELQKCVLHCNKNKTLLRYFDLVEIVRFIKVSHVIENAIEDHLKMKTYFENDISKITMDSLKQYYMHLLKHISRNEWSKIHKELVGTQENKLFNKHKLKKFYSIENKSTDSNAGKPLARTQSVAVGENYKEKRTVPSSIYGLHVTTNDAQTLTDGPTIFFAENIENIANYYIQQTNMPPRVFQSVYQKIENNSVIQEKLTQLEHKLEDIQEKKMNNDSKDSESSKKKGKSNLNMLNRDNESNNSDTRKLSSEIEILYQQISDVKLEPYYIPNTKEHQELWHSEFKENAFQPRISEEDVCNIMATDVSNHHKMLLLLGIGMFTDENKANPRYMEIMKKLAYDQHLYLILASSDFIYGTNYQFCHGYIGKDLKNMTQQKTIQAMGRIGRNSMQQEYTIRFRDDKILYQLFQTSNENTEANVMNRLFS